MGYWKTAGFAVGLVYIRIFSADTVKVIPLGWDNNALSVGVLVCRHIHKGQLEFYRAVEVVEKITPALEDSRFIFIMRP